MHRREMIFSSLAFLSACGREELSGGKSPKLKLKVLDGGFPDLADAARPGVFNAAVMNLEGGETWYWNADRAMPLGPCAALPIMASVLSEADTGELRLDETISLKDMDLSPPPSAVAQAWPNQADWSVRALITAAAGGDNTAMDVLTRRVGGPGGVKAWLIAKGMTDMHVDRYRREVRVEAFDMVPFRPAWRTPAAFQAAIDAVPAAPRQAAMTAYQTDPRDTATPQSVINLLNRITTGAALSPASTRILLDLAAAQPDLCGLAAGLPNGARLAQFGGADLGADGICLSHNAMAICTLADGRTYALAAFLSGSTAGQAQRTELFARFMRLAAKSFG
ncbi:MAG: beta-lactamase [Caulobacteraceae bacterium]|nr:beta-lactamase [Caulobacteraceae bacterium]